MSTLIGLRNDVSDPSVQELLSAYSYDKDRETERVRVLDQLQRRTAQQIREEEELIIESRRMESQSKRIIKDRQNVVRLLAAVDATLVPATNIRKQNAIAMGGLGGGLGGLSGLGSGSGGSGPDGKHKKKKKGAILRVGSEAGSPLADDFEADDSAFFYCFPRFFCCIF